MDKYDDLTVLLRTEDALNNQILLLEAADAIDELRYELALLRAERK